jgi:hypothetical protein
LRDGPADASVDGESPAISEGVFSSASQSLESMPREAELVENALARAARTKTGISSGMRASMPAQARKIVAERMIGNTSWTVPALMPSFAQSSTVTFWYCLSGHVELCGIRPWLLFAS